MLTQEIRSKVQTLWDRLWAGGHSNPITAIEQISYLLFMKRLEEFKPKISEEYKWSHYHTFEGSKLVNHVKKVVFPFVRNQLSKEGEPFAQAMTDAVFVINKPPLLKDAMNFIDHIYQDIGEQSKITNQHLHDIQGDVYEHLLKHTSEAGKNGQFRTPRHIIHLMAEILDPDLDGKICDLASGTGGFLVGAYQYLVSKYSVKTVHDDDGLIKGLDGRKLTKKQNKILTEDTFYGFDIDQTMVRIGVMNLMMHGISKPNIIYLDALSANYEAIESERMKKKVINKGDHKPSKNETEGQYKYILANPPFTGKIDSAGISPNIDRIYPPIFENDKKTRKDQTVQSELLFLERIIYMLETGGRAAVIVPEGVLFNTGRAYKTIREILLTDCNLEGVVSLPSGVFQPYTNVKTSILIFSKRKFRNNSKALQNTKVWFYDMKSDGYSLDTNRKRLKETPLPDVVDSWKNRYLSDQSNRQLDHFSIPVSEIRDNEFILNFNAYRDFVYVPKEFPPSEIILKKLQAIERELQQGLVDIENLG